MKKQKLELENAVANYNECAICNVCAIVGPEAMLVNVTLAFGE